MASSALAIQVSPPKIPQGTEPNPSQPLEQDDDQKMRDLLAKYGKKLIDLCTTKRNTWMQKRLGIIQKILKNKEMHKGNQYLGIYPGSFQAFDAIGEYDNWTGTSDQKNGDTSMDIRCHNFYQMVEKAYVAALGSTVPKTRPMPMNADAEEDRETAKVAGTIQAIVAKRNKAPSMLLQQLMELFTGGYYIRTTSYVVDAARTGTHKQTVLKVSKQQVVPASFICSNCGTPTPAAQVNPQQPQCPECGSPLNPQTDFYPDHADEMPVAEEQTDIPNGMVMHDIYGGLHADMDPDSPDLLNTPLVNIALEVQLGWLRQTFPDMWEKFSEGMTAGSATDQLERLYRDMLSMPSGYSTWFSLTTQSKPTYNRTWINPMLFGEMPSRPEAEELNKAFPKGCMLAWTGDIPLILRPAVLTDELTWCGTEQKGFGLCPPPAGDPGVPVQERINDCLSKIDEYMDRLACGILLANEEYISTEKMNSQQMLPGRLNPVKFRKGQAANIAEAIFQVKGEIDSLIFQYYSILTQTLELLVGTPPQIFGAGTQDGVETKGGQQQQLNTGMQKLGLQWKFVGDENAEASENAVKCMQKNATEDWMDVVSDETREFRNEYVHLDQIKGSVHIENDDAQGFPMSYADQKAFWDDLLQNADNQFAQMVLAVPENLDAAIRFVCPPGFKAPDGALRGKMLQILAILIKGKPIQGQDPVTGQPQMYPSIMPDKYLDGPELPTMVKLIPAWWDAKWDWLKDNQPARDNLVAYYKVCQVYIKELQAETQLAGPPPPGNGPPQNPKQLGQGA